MHAAQRPCHPATFTHSFQRICAAKIYSIAFAPPHSRRLIHTVLMRPHSCSTYAAALTLHLCSSIDAAALKLPRPHSTYSAAPTPQHLCCSSHAASFFAAAFTQPLHGAASMPRSHTPAFTPQHLCCSIRAAAFFRRSHAAALMPSHATAYLCRRTHASACTPSFLCRSMHATAFTQLSRRRIDAVALTPQHWCRSSDAAASHTAAFFGRNISPSTSRCSIHASHLRCR